MPIESEIISRIRKQSLASADVIVGIGDDAAVIRRGARDLITCCDVMVENVHFRRNWTTAHLLGRKALAVTLSDIAAMGGVPQFAMISIALPGALCSRFIDEVFLGIFELADKSGVSIIGGDTSSSPGSIFIDTIALGECATGKAITRSGARLGDEIYITGTLGASALGLSLLEQGARLDSENDSARVCAMTKHLAPEPRLKFGAAIGEAGLASAMIDVSDGLSTDLWHILDESKVGAIIRADSIPVDKSARLLLKDSEDNIVRFALHSGEEYELLFTARPDSRSAIQSLVASLGVPVSLIGEIISDRGLKLESGDSLEAIKSSGYEHVI